jgi:hypothetical protein
LEGAFAFCVIFVILEAIGVWGIGHGKYVYDSVEDNGKHSDENDDM